MRQTLTQKVAWNTLVQIIGRVFLVALSLVTIGILTRYLGVSQFGDYSLVFAYVAIFTVLADLGFFVIIVRDLARIARKKDKERFISNIFTLRTLAAVGVYALAFGVGLMVYRGNQQIQWGIGLASLAFIWLSLQNTLIAVFQADYRMDKSVISDLAGRVAILVIIVLLTRHGAGLLTLLWAYIGGNFLSFAVVFLFIRQKYRIAWRFEKEVWLRVLRQSAPLGLVIVLNTIYFRVDTLMLSLMKGSFDVGIYAPPFKILEVIMIIPAIFINTVLPIYSRYLQDGDKRITKAIQKTFLGMAMLAIPVVFGTFAIADKIIAFVAGGEFARAGSVSPLGLAGTPADVLRILVIGAGIGYFNNVFAYLVVADNKQARLIIPSIIFVLFNVLTNFILIPKYSYIGASFTTLSTELLVLLVMFYLANQITRARPSLREFWKVLLVGVIMYGVLKQVPELNIFWSLVLAGIVYIGGLVILGLSPLKIIGSLRKHQRGDLKG